jgi:phytoene dehydrogenase-like protein
LLNPKIIRDLDLPRHGLRVVERPLANFLPLNASQFLKVGAGRTEQEVAKFSARDAGRLSAYGTRLDRVADVLRDLVLETPPNVTEGTWLHALPELLRGARLGKRISKLDMTLRRELLDLFVKSAGDYLDSWFESAPIKAAYGFDGIVGNYARGGRRHDRAREHSRAELQGIDPWPSNHEPAGSRADLRADRRGHFPRRLEPREPIPAAA